MGARETARYTQTVDLVMKARCKTDKDAENEFLKFLSDFLRSNDLAASKEDADDMAFTLQIVSKGLLLKCRTKQEFDQGMGRATKMIL